MTKPKPHQMEACKGLRWAFVSHMRGDGFSAYVYECKPIAVQRTQTLHNAAGKECRTVTAYHFQGAEFNSLADVLNAVEAAGMLPKPEQKEPAE